MHLHFSENLSLIYMPRRQIIRIGGDMMEDLLQSVREYNFISLLLLFILLGSILQGLLRGASRSAGRLFSLLSGGVLSLLGIAAAIPLTLWISPKVQGWLAMLEIPQRELALWEQVFYTFIMAVRDFPLMRFAVVFILMYWLIRTIAGLAAALSAAAPGSGGCSRAETARLRC